MKIFGHYVALPAALLAALDGVLLFSFILALDAAQACQSCSLDLGLQTSVFQALLLTAAFVAIGASMGIYNRDAVLDFRTFLRRFVLLWNIILVATIGFFALVKAAAGLPFGWYVGILSVVIIGFMAMLLAVRALLILRLDHTFLKKRIMIIGEGPVAAAVADFVGGPGRTHLRQVRAAETACPVDPVIAASNLAINLDRSPSPSIAALAASLHPDVIVVAVEDKRGLSVTELLECKLKGIEIIDSLTFWEREAGQIDFANTGAGWLAFASGFALDQPSRTFKRVADCVISLSFLVAVFPLALFVALAIKLDSRGPVFYRQERVGFNGEVFKVWKFRSMRTDAERDGVARWASSNDNRVTRVGKFIRRVRIDEIPQIVNVLSGDMSFVGPRPERPVFVDQLRKDIPYYDLRHKVKPGITGWAQINFPYGDSLEDAKQKLAYDLYYLKNHDPILDLAIMAQTVRVILFAHGSR